MVVKVTVKVKVKVKVKVEVKVKLKVNFSLEQAKKAKRGVELQLYSFFNLGARCGWVINAKPPPLYPPPGKTRYPLYRTGA